MRQGLSVTFPPISDLSQHVGSVVPHCGAQSPTTHPWHWPPADVAQAVAHSAVVFVFIWKLERSLYMWSTPMSPSSLGVQAGGAEEIHELKICS